MSEGTIEAISRTLANVAILGFFIGAGSGYALARFLDIMKECNGKLECWREHIEDLKKRKIELEKRNK